MLHPHTELRFINDTIGYGIFATHDIPKGTITYAKDALEIQITPEAYNQLAGDYKRISDKYSYIDENGIRIISWDHAKYMNHRCDCNSMSTGYGFEIAIRDIQKDEEVTDEYALFNLEEDMPVACGCDNCREVIRTDDIDRYHPEWDERIMQALQVFQQVEQPLLALLDHDTRINLMAYLNGHQEYRSVQQLKFIPATKSRKTRGMIES